jgi:hypothetical protein
MIDSYLFGQVFQMRLLALLVQHPQKVVGIIKPQYFTIGNHTTVSRVAQELYDKYLPEKPDFRLDYDTLKEAIYAAEPALAEDSHRRRSLKRLLKDIFSVQPDNYPPLIDQAREFAKEQQYREMLIAAEKDITNGNYNRVHERFDKLRTLLSGTGDGGLTWDSAPRFDPDAVRDTKWLVEILFAEGTLSLIYGPRGAFKSTFILAAAGAVASGEEFLGMKTRKRKVLYLDYENPPDVIKNRVIDLGLGLPENENLVIWDRFGKQPPPHPGDPRLQEFVRHCIEAFHRRPWIIFDSGSSILRRGEGGETTGQTAPLYTDLRKLCDTGASISILDHTRKYEEEIIYGGQDKEAKADTLHNFILHKNTIKPERPIVYVKSWLKRYTPEGEGRLAVEVQSFKDEDGKWHVTGFEPTEDPIVEEKKRYRRILRDLIRDNPDSSQRELANLAAERGMGRDKAEEMLKKGIDKYWAVGKGDGRKLVYKLLED